MTHLFKPLTVGNLQVPNRIAMAPMTRSRAINNVPNDLMAEYYAQRASAGLIITEGTAPSPSGLGYARIPGIFSGQQVEAWKKVTHAVHEQGGRIFLQLMHTGRVAHPQNLPEGFSPVAPSVVKLQTTKMWVDQAGLVGIPEPKALTTAEVYDVIDDYITAAQNAMHAGFDGIELHGANGYLIKQFINPYTNQRTDEFGGRLEGRAQFLLDIVEGVARVIGRDKVGVRVSPYGWVNEMPSYNESDATYLYVARKLQELDIAYLHVTDQTAKGAPHALASNLRTVFQNTLILSGGYTAETAEVVIGRGEADLVSFGKPFIPNPDLVYRFQYGLPLNQPKQEYFYTPGPTGYVDYPVFEEVNIVSERTLLHV